MDKIEAANSYSALVWATMGAGLITMIFYLVQFTRDGEMIYNPNLTDIKEVFMSQKAKQEDPVPRARSVMSLRDSVDSFLIGVGRVFPATIVLTLAWASGSIMGSVGCDRLFASWIVGGVNPESLPTLSFLISLFMALAVSSRRNVSIRRPSPPFFDLAPFFHRLERPGELCPFCSLFCSFQCTMLLAVTNSCSTRLLLEFCLEAWQVII